MSTGNILDGIAVARRSEGEAATILQAYISTAPQMTQTHAPQAAPTAGQSPKGTGAGDKLVEPN